MCCVGVSVVCVCVCVMPVLCVFVFGACVVCVHVSVLCVFTMDVSQVFLIENYHRFFDKVLIKNQLYKSLFFKVI